jgi:hypothetical protein
MRPQRPSLCGQSVAGQVKFQGRRPGAVGFSVYLPGGSSKRRIGVAIVRREFLFNVRIENVAVSEDYTIVFGICGLTYAP